ncbi:hypothetical protein phiA829_167 [Aeromonas phage phiA8-29]|uniref:Uncharacterized protein n=1 Tax=Aeromonas phage phiA8-29 TaxID=1978922 RepID=A0A1W6DY95_9CAUD|nr:head closure Hc2 [Aeromonas phage phiA8-29]ARK07987.1 hypothetical protein phiA829_167 [Aeromonas phage phiA8-29]
MRLDGSPSLSGVRSPDEILPSHFSKSYPQLVEFLEIYSSFLYDKSLQPHEVQEFISDESWWDKRNNVFSSPEERLFYKIRDLQETRKLFGFEQNNVQLVEQKSLLGGLTNIRSLDGLILGSSDSREIDADDKQEIHLQSWLSDKGLTVEETIDSFDIASFVKLARHIFKIRGSMECARIFFEAMYGGRVISYLPRVDISALDSNMVLDGTNYLRDDSYYDEFTYEINLIGSKYRMLGQKYFDLWKERFHPGGFKCVFNVYTDEEWLIVSGALGLPEKIGVWKQFFEGPFALTMRKLGYGY